MASTAAVHSAGRECGEGVSKAFEGQLGSQSPHGAGLVEHSPQCLKDGFPLHLETCTDSSACAMHSSAYTVNKQHVKVTVSHLSLFKGRVVENISKRCGGFLRKLSLRGCIGVGDSSLK